MTEKTFNRIMAVTFLGLLITIIAVLPRAIDQMYYEQYELPVKKMEEIQNDFRSN